MSIAEQIAIENRRTGSTTWILKAAVNDPNCTIVCKSADYSYDLEREYKKMLSKSNWLLRLKWKLFGRNHPQFISAYSAKTYYVSSPLIFDNSSLSAK